MCRFWCSECGYMYWGRGISYKGGLYCSGCYKQIRYRELEKEMKADEDSD